MLCAEPRAGRRRVGGRRGRSGRRGHSGRRGRGAHERVGAGRAVALSVVSAARHASGVASHAAHTRPHKGEGSKKFVT